MSELTDLFLQRACSGMFSDELDKLGFRGQVIDGLQVNNPRGRIYGPVRTVRIETLETDDENIRTGLGFLERLLPGELLFVEGSRSFAYFGELMSRLSLRGRVGGVVIGGLTRDSLFTQELTALTVFAEGYSPKDIKGRGRVAATDVAIAIRGVSARPGDHAFGDRDGVVVVPREARAELERRVASIIAGEDDIIRSIDAGASVGEILSRHKEF